jgi:hypothetical protein
MGRSCVGQSGRLGLVVLTLATALACSSSAPPAGRTVDEPTDPLRPQPQRGEVPADAHVVDYVMEATLHPDERRIDGKSSIHWRNTSSVATDRIEMHLYMNGFRAEDTHWMQQGRGSHRGNRQDTEAPWGYCDVTEVRRAEGPTLEFAEGDDPSVMTIRLDDPVSPGDAVDLQLQFTTVLPRVFARTGVADGFVMAGQWFPKVAVLEPDGRWSNHVFGFHSEFYADFGDYDVLIDVPHPMKVGATGIEVEAHDDGERRRVRYRASMVHDFAFTAWDGFEEWDTEQDGIRVRMLAPPQFAQEVPAHFETQLQTLHSMEERFGPYPWSTITIVLPPRAASGAMGMEYPTLYTTSPAEQVPPWLAPLGYRSRGATFTTVHEFGHQYFQGLLASNEYAQPWLDEGLNTFSNALALADRYGPDPMVVELAGVPLTLSQAGRLLAMSGSPSYPIDTDADGFAPYTGEYSRVVYRRTASLLATLRTLAGQERFDAAMRAYTDRFRFRHPRGEDFVAVLIEEIGRFVPLAQADPELGDSSAVQLDVADFLRQGLETTHDVGFAVFATRNRRRPGDAGWHRNAQGDLVGGEAPDFTAVQQREDADVEALVIVQRTGDFTVPVEVDVEFADGEHERLWWDGRSRLRELRWPGRRVVSASVDPDGRLLMEADRTDNHRFAPASIRSRRGPAQDLGDLAEAITLTLLLGGGP